MAEVTEYKGNPVLNLDTEGKYPFSFGVAKAVLIMENWDEIVNFVSEYGNDEQKAYADEFLQ